MTTSRMLRRSSALLLLALAPAPGDAQREIGSPAHAERARSASANAEVRPAAAAVRPDEAPNATAESEPDASCAELIARAESEPAEPGTPRLDKARDVVLLYAKAEPVVFTREPAANEKGSEAARTYRSMLRTTSSPWGILDKLWPVFSLNPELGRAVLLRDGYLYADRPELAFALVDLVTVQMLFSDRSVWIQRGERTLHAERTKAGRYVFTDGAERGQRVKLLLFDRIGTGTPPAPLHRDFRALRQELGFDAVDVKHLGAEHVVANLRYGALAVPTLLAADGAHLSRVCEEVPAGGDAALARLRSEHARQERALAPLRAAIRAGVQEGLPFDEPLTEYGQQDGRLRAQWLAAYEGGQSDFEFQTDKYYVFNATGRPLVPEVCVDFIFDSFERASGTWWRPRGEPRGRVVGKLDFTTLPDEQRRRATSFIDYAERHPEWFDVYTVPESDRVPFKFGKRLADYLVAAAPAFRPGDVVLIRGYAPWDKPWKPRPMHFHSFFVYESDPVTGMPIALAGNPGRPLLQTWQFEAFRTPDRSIWYRVRPRLDWLEQNLNVASTPEVPPPPPLTAELAER
ncbi:MAG TPA: hypothetical protein VMI54_25585 [Polyangiaceae bacterium]|nr:hypothetical protein [Polyangiaceae bacterium]